MMSSIKNCQFLWGNERDGYKRERLISLASKIKKSRNLFQKNSQNSGFGDSSGFHGFRPVWRLKTIAELEVEAATDVLAAIQKTIVSKTKETKHGFTA
ncbi:hypothetical protein FACS1894158_00140 [Betaproteobacteria bacterium]|nr:hypothetical protein FACS1894158_00140 [Betaproteobacteria bacterium]